MTRTAFDPAIRSRPVYGVLEPRAGTGHLVVADGAGGAAVLELMGKAAGAMRQSTAIIYMPGVNGEDLSAQLQGAGFGQFFRSPSFAAALPRLRRILGEARMGLQVYAAGSEGVMGQVQREVMAAGLDHTALQMEHRGSLARRVQCVHCKGITENVRHDPFVCSHCGLNLFVRDHYSRRIAAFQGVNIDAEDPGQVPAAVERFA